MEALNTSASMEHYVLNQQEEIKDWIHELTGYTVTGAVAPEQTEEEEADCSWLKQLKDGATFCQLLNALRPDVVPHIRDATNTPLVFLREYENIKSFIEGCEVLGVPKHDMFQCKCR